MKQTLTTLAILTLASCASTAPGAQDSDKMPVAFAVKHVNASPTEEGSDSMTGVGAEVRVTFREAVENQPQLSFEFGVTKVDTEGLELGVISTEVEATEVRAGIDAQFLTGAFRPYLAGGLSMIDATATASYYGMSTGIEDDAIGLYIGAGFRAFFDVGSAAPFLDAGIRQTFGHSGEYGELDFFAFTVGAGVSF